MTYLWAMAGIASLALALVGIVTPILPTVPFLLLAAFCFSKSSPRLHHWLVTHPRLGPPIQDWQERGAISRRAKHYATVSLVLVLGLSVWFSLPTWVLFLQAAIMGLVALFIWTRPSV